MKEGYLLQHRVMLWRNEENWVQRAYVGVWRREDVSSIAVVPRRKDCCIRLHKSVQYHILEDVL